jgi:hypothetical protein
MPSCNPLTHHIEFQGEIPQRQIALKILPLFPALHLIEPWRRVALEFPRLEGTSKRDVGGKERQGEGRKKRKNHLEICISEACTCELKI